MKRRAKPLREIRLTPEGWVFLIILGFIATGAVLRNVNLLILMSGLMFAPLIINWRIGVLRLKTISAKRAMPHRVYARQIFNVQWICSNSSKLAAWNLQVIDEIDRLEEHEDLKKRKSQEQAESKKGLGRLFGWIRKIRLRHATRLSRVRINFVQVAANSTQAGSYRAFFARRGRYAAGPAEVMTSFPFGLVASRILAPERHEFYVAPSLGNLTPTWDRRVQSVVVGSDAIKRKRGLEEDEFYALRPWRSGDSKKHIHWRTSAKYGQPIVRQHDQPDNRDFAMLLDLHCHDEINEDSVDPEIETILSFAATVVLHLGSAIQGRIAVGICGESNELCRSRSHREIVDQAMRKFAVAEPASDPDFVDTMLTIARSVSGSTPIYVVSTRDEPDHAKFLNSVADNDVFESSHEARLFNRLRNVWPQVRWLKVGSEEFNKLYSPADSNRDVEPQMIEQLSKKWMNSNAPS